MANFDLTTYPLATETFMADDLNVARDIMDDGTLGIRVLGSSAYRTISCVFEHMDAATSAAFAAYLVTNRATELDMLFGFRSPQDTYRGYIWGNPSFTVVEGVWHVWTMEFRGKKI